MEQQAKKRKTKVVLPKDLSAVTHLEVDSNVGLTAEQVAQRTEQGLINTVPKKGKSILGIILSNTFTFFNCIYFIFAILLLINNTAENEMWKQCTFLIIAFANTAIAIVQEIKSKLTLDKLNIVNEPRSKVLRDGTLNSIPVGELALDDVVTFATGEQISTDCTVLDGFAEVNESILTGESDAVTKRKGDTLFAGSYVVSGNCTAQVSAVGQYNYISGLTNRAKQYSKPRSQMLKALKSILVFVAIIVVPLTVFLFVMNVGANQPDFDWTTFRFSDIKSTQALTTALKLTSGSIIAMIPAGPFLLTSVALAVSFLRLAKNKTVVQELYCIEMLARVDTLCLDKTGTITDGTMRVVESIDLRPNSAQTNTIREIMSSFNSAQNNDNMTGKALKKFFGAPKRPTLTATTVLPFSSERKLSAVTFKGAGTYILGAPEFVLKTPNERVGDLVTKYAEQGLRVLLLAHSTSSIYDSNTIPQVRRPIAVIVIEDHIRSDAPSTIDWFKQNGVDVKVISGDNPQTVSSIALRVGIDNADKFVSLEGMSNDEVARIANDYTVFGRVSPDQKAVLVKALRSVGHTVAMTGDGVNDILAMKESDCSISLAGGSDAARQVAHLVLMDDSFSNLPKVVKEGRRVVNNIQSATSMYFMKTVYVIVLNIALIALYWGLGMATLSPLTTTQTTLMDTVVVGLPTMLLALQPNESQIKGRFLINVLKRCLPASLTFIITTFSFYALNIYDGTFVSIDDGVLGTLVTLTYTFGGLFALFYACKPFNKWKVVMYLGIWAIILFCVIGCCNMPVLANFFEYVTLNREQLLLLLVEILAMPFLLFGLVTVFHVDKKHKYTLKK